MMGKPATPAEKALTCWRVARATLIRIEECLADAQAAAGSKDRTEACLADALAAAGIGKEKMAESYVELERAFTTAGVRFTPKGRPPGIQDRTLARMTRALPTNKPAKRPTTQRGTATVSFHNARRRPRPSRRP